MDVWNFIRKLSRFAERHNFQGYDPYDALNSPIVRLLSFNNKYLRIAWLQFLRRLPVNIRPLLLIQPGHNPKALALFLAGYVRLQKIDPSRGHLDKINTLFELLRKNISQGYSGSCWGYNFDWQNRAFWLPKYTPTVVNTAFAGHALLDAWFSLGEQRFLDLAVSTKDFLLKDLNRTYDGDTFCFSYTPLDNTTVHNANLLGASLLIRLFHITGDGELRQCATQSLAYSMKRQNPDGSWYYADTEFQRWIDSFHTGFNLEAIRHFLALGEAEQFRLAYEKGVRFYAKHFFLEDGTPKYYHNRVYPIDIHAPAQAIAFFSAEGKQYQKLTDKILSWMCRNMWDERGFFYFRKGRFITNKIPYMRWSQAWCFRALTCYIFHRRTGELAEEEN